MRPLRPLVLVLALAGAACGGGEEPDPEAVRTELIAELRAALPAESDGAIDDDAAGCVAEKLVDTYGAHALEAAVRTPEDEDKVRNEVIDIFASCDALAPLLEPAP